jgi:hypothetical protein
MTDAFIPLSPAAFGRQEPVSTALPASGTASAGALSPAVHSVAACAKPSVTLQRNGDVVTSIRVQCGCGQVIDINCQF